MIVLTSGLNVEDLLVLNNFLGGVSVAPYICAFLPRITGVVICGGLGTAGGRKAEVLREVDSELAKLSGKIDIFLMASNEDTSEPLWPSRPISKYLLPKSCHKI